MTQATQPFTPLPFRGPAFYILLGLTIGDQDGYALLQAVKDLSGGGLSIGASSLYAILARLVAEGWIERLDSDGSNFIARYSLTSSGYQAIQAEITLLTHAAQVTHV